MYLDNCDNKMGQARCQNAHEKNVCADGVLFTQTEPAPVANLIISHIARQSWAASTHELHPTGNVLSVHLMSRFEQCPQKGCVCYIPHGRTCRLETNCNANRSSTRARSADTLLTDVTSVPVHFWFLSTTPLHRTVQAPVGPAGSQ